MRLHKLQSFKSFALKIALEEYGHLVLLRLIDVTDDTVLVRKALYGVRPRLFSLFPPIQGPQFAITGLRRS